MRALCERVTRRVAFSVARADGWGCHAARSVSCGERDAHVTAPDGDSAATAEWRRDLLAAHASVTEYAKCEGGCCLAGV